jgi:hypothetical protein
VEAVHEIDLRLDLGRCSAAASVSALQRLKDFVEAANDSTSRTSEVS